MSPPVASAAAVLRQMFWRCRREPCRLSALGTNQGLAMQHKKDADKSGPSGATLFEVASALQVCGIARHSAPARRAAGAISRRRAIWEGGQRCLADKAGRAQSGGSSAHALSTAAAIASNKARQQTAAENASGVASAVAHDSRTEARKVAGCSGCDH